MTVANAAARAIAPRALRAWLAEIFTAAGLAPGDADAVARNLADAELRGVQSHGLLLVPMYAERIAAGVVNVRYRPRVVREAPGMLVVDGDAGPGQPLLFDALDRIEEPARANGIALVTVTASNHAGMLATYGFELARRGFASVVMTNAGPSVGAFGARGQRVGNNALCFTFPQEAGDPVCFDMATGQIATGKVRVLELSGEPVPERALVDRDGVPARDASALRDGGWVLPLGGHKGFGLSVAVDMLTAILGGGPPSASVDNGPRTARLGLTQTVIAIDVERARGGGAFAAAASAYANLLRALPPLDPDRPVRVPGDVELERAREQRDALMLHPALLAGAEAVAARLGVAPLSEPR
jgi:LDH2 family malate/lactate/ureidoglycolate dehydrogenase